MSHADSVVLFSLSVLSPTAVGSRSHVVPDHREALYSAALHQLFRALWRET